MIILTTKKMKQQKILVIKTVFTDYSFLPLEKQKSVLHELSEVNSYLQNGFFIKRVIWSKDPNDKWPLFFIILEKNKEKECFGELPFSMGNNQHR